MIGWLAIGFVFGLALAGALCWAIARGAIARTRAAERRARAAERLAEIGSMTSGLAHEIRNPLSTIALNAGLLREGIGDLEIPEEERGRISRRVDALRRETERLRGILEDFLQFAGELHVEPIPGDINELVEELVDFFQPQADRNGVRVRTQLAPGELIAPIDAAHLKQAVLNLMLNAVQAMREQEKTRELILRTERGVDESREACAIIHVIDTGPGIGSETLGRIYEPYFTTKAGGTGLGLATTRRIIEAHGGHLEVDSEVGKGTGFRVVLGMGE